MTKILLLLVISISLYATDPKDTGVSIELFSQHPEAVESVFKLWYDNLGKRYYAHPDECKDRYTAFLKDHTQKENLPLAYIALKNNVPIGLACLRKKPVSTNTCAWFVQHPDIYPWVAGLVVAEEYRKQGIATQLAHATVKHAQQLGFNKLYLFAEDPSMELDIYKKHGCTEIDQTTYQEKKFSIMKFEE